jgi:two-component system response regulator DesR
MLKVMLVARSGLMRLGLTAMLARATDMTVVAEVGSYEEVLPQAQRALPEVILLDPLSEKDLDVDARIGAVLPDCTRLWLLGPETPAPVCARLGGMFDLWGSFDLWGPSASIPRRIGVLSKSTDPSELCRLIRHLAEGRRVMDGPAREALWRMKFDNPLTAREQQILLQTALGLSAYEVARSLGLSPGTVRNYLANAALKLGARNSLHAVGIATQAGWIGTYSVLSIYDEAQ